MSIFLIRNKLYYTGNKQFGKPRVNKDSFEQIESPKNENLNAYGREFFSVRL